MTVRFALAVVPVMLTCWGCGSSTEEPVPDGGRGPDAEVGRDGSHVDGTLTDGGAPTSALACRFQDALKAQEEALYFRRTSPATEVLIVRGPDADGPPMGYQTYYALVAFAVLHEGKLSCIDDASALDYQSSHHNWTDVATATSAQLRYELKLLFQPEDPNDPVGSPWVWTYRLSGFDPGGTLLFGPILVQPVSLK